jgi:heme exporter protein D
MKRTSGYFALSSFGFLLIGMVYLFIISQEKRENRLKVDKQQREWQMQHKKQDSVKSIN